MVDWGIVSTAVATIIGSVATGLGTWWSMRNKEKKEIDDAQVEFINTLRNEVESLRARVAHLQETIDVLMEERRELKNTVTDLEIEIRKLKGNQ
jgi:peptidoglycan hydrolase CwlO-like protein